MRGKHLSRVWAERRNGITPADAGKTVYRRNSLHLRKDHPRGCGENSITRVLEVTRQGSPPRMRGKPRAVWRANRASGITPADAGKTVRSRERMDEPWDHPRGCGENFGKAVNVNVWIGSPPRMRGKRMCDIPNNIQFGDHPADAGKTAAVREQNDKAQDHPRGCGENPARFDCCLRQPGSPPRMRGKRAIDEFRKAFPGITPADAGKTGLFTCSKMRTEDHPRGCGENSFSPYSQIGQLGSPPRMRGKHHSKGLYYPSLRITPADAGKTFYDNLLNNNYRDHPRGCGENGAVCSDTKIDRGSPPRMRGKLLR